MSSLASQVAGSASILLSKLESTAWGVHHTDMQRPRFEEIFKENRAVVFTICRRILASDEDAADALQNTFIRFLSGPENWPPAIRSSEPSTVLRRLAAMESDNLRKRRARRWLRETDTSRGAASEQKQNSPATAIEQKEMLRAVEDLVSTLPVKYRLPLQLHYFHGLTTREVAETLGISEVACRQRISRAVRKLRRRARSAGFRDLLSTLAFVSGGASLLAPPLDVTADQVLMAWRDGTPVPSALEATSLISTPVIAGVVSVTLLLAALALPVPKSKPSMTSDMAFLLSTSSTGPVAGKPESPVLSTTGDDNAQPGLEASETTSFAYAPMPYSRDDVKDAQVVSDRQPSLVIVHNGVPVPGIEIEIHDTDTAPEIRLCGDCPQGWRSFGSNTHLADENGRVVFPPETEGAFLVVTGCGKRGWIREQIPIPRDGFTGDRTIELSAHATVTGRAVDTSGAPVSGATVQAAEITVSGRQGPWIRDTLTSPEGDYTLEGLPGLIVLAVAPPIESGCAPPPVQTLELAAEEVRLKADFVLPTGVPFEGTVMDLDGLAVSHVRISSSHGNSTTTDNDGKFSLLLSPEKDFYTSLTFVHPSFQSQAIENIAIEESPLDVILDYRPIVVLDVRELSGEYVSNFEWNLSKRESGGAIGITAKAKSSTAVDSGGLLEIGRLEAGAWHVDVRKLDSSLQPTSLRGMVDFKVRGGRFQEVAVPVGEGRTVSGVVLDDQMEQPVPEAIVSIQIGLAGSGHASVHEDTTHSDGSFSFPGIPEGNFRIDAMRGDTGGHANVQVHLGKRPDPVVVRLKQFATVYGQVIGQNGEPIPNALVTLTPHGRWKAADRHTRVRTGIDGIYRIPLIEPGTYWASCNSPEFKTKHYISIEAGTEEEIDFDVTEMVTLAGTISINGRPWSGEPQLNFATNVRKSNRAPIESLGKGAYRSRVARAGIDLWVTMPGHNLVAKSWTPEEIPGFDTKNAHLNIALEFTEATVSIEPPASEALSAGVLSLSRRSLELREVLSGGESRKIRESPVRFEWILPGTYTAKFHSNDGKWFGSSSEHVLEAGQNKLIKLDLRSVNRRVLAGSWRTDLVASEFQPLDLDVTELVKEMDSFLASFEYQSGKNALLIESVSLICDGTEVSHDVHLGWSGFELRDHIYTLRNSGQASERMILRSIVRSAGDSNGEIWIIDSGD